VPSVPAPPRLVDARYAAAGSRRRRRWEGAARGWPPPVDAGRRAVLALLRLVLPSGCMPAPAKTVKSRPWTAPSTRDCVGRRRAPHGADEILAGGDAGAGDLLVGGVARAGEILAGGARPPGRGRRRAE